MNGLPSLCTIHLFLGLFGGVQKKGQRLFCCLNCVTRGPFYHQAKAHMQNFVETDFGDFVVGPLMQSSRTPVWEPLLIT